jgi:carbamoyltransferase
LKQQRSFDIVGINKGRDCSSVAMMDSKTGKFEVHLRERISRIKRDGDPYLVTVQNLVHARRIQKEVKVAETGFYENPKDFENQLNSGERFSEYLRNFDLRKFSRLTNPDVRFVTHHRAHAQAARWMSPFRKALIVVVDGIGSSTLDFVESHPERGLVPPSKKPVLYEAATAYRLENNKLECIYKDFQEFDRKCGRIRNVSIGHIFEIAAELIFGSQYEAGKVMGLAPFGKPQRGQTRDEFFLDIRDRLAAQGFKGKTKAEWEKSEFLREYRCVAATAQSIFERDLNALIRKLHASNSDLHYLILAGGCALNCVFNARLSKKKMFKQIYIPPFPGDEGVGLGAAVEMLTNSAKKIRPKGISNIIYPGPHRERLAKSKVRQMFKGAQVFDRTNSRGKVIQHLEDGEVIGVFDGTSEAGPRALGHRSLLASPLISGQRAFLNRVVKSRESFRPFGVVVPKHLAVEYVEIDRNQPSPHMDFAPKVQQMWRKRLAEVVHVDGTCRIQTLDRSQNPWLYDLLLSFRKQTGVGCLINTSLNVMNEPIVESAADLMKFWEARLVNCLIVDDHFVVREK